MAGKGSQFFLGPPGMVEDSFAHLLDQKNHQGIGDDGAQRQDKVDSAHEGHGCCIDDDGVHDIEESETDQHADIRQVVGKAGEDVAGPFPGEIGEVERYEPGVEILADLILYSPSGMEQGRAGENAHHTVCRGCGDYDETVVTGSVGRRRGFFQAFHR